MGTTSERPGRVIVLGLDGLEWTVIDALLGEGRLPAFRHILQHGYHAAMQSTTPPLTPAAWSTLFSGEPPERHGIFDFTARDSGRYSFRLCTAKDRRARMLWSMAGEAGRSVAVLNVPMTFPASQVNGLMVSGMDAPNLEGAVYPPSETAAVLAISPDYTVDAMSHWFDDPDVFATELKKMHEARHRVALDVLRRRSPDLFVCVYVLADRVQHVSWSDTPSTAVVEAYETLDGALGDYLELLGENDSLVIVSDHGFQTLRTEICVNQVFEQAGLLVLDERRCIDLLRRHNRRLLHSRGGGCRSYESWWHLPPRALWFDGVDWSRTRCAAFGLMGNMMLNIRGRDPQGLVSIGADSAAVLRDVEQAVSERLRQAFGEIRVIAHPVDWDRERSRSVDPPDAVLEIDGYRIGTWGGREFFAPGLVHESLEGHTGVHSPTAVLMAVGPGLEASGERADAAAVDLVPTVLHLLGMAPVEHLRGRSVVGR